MATDPTAAALPALPSGLRVREIQTTTVTEMVDGAPVTRVVPALDAEGREIELFATDVPQHVEAEGSTEITMHVDEERAKVAALADAATAQEG